mmetsp:Transcript_104562/g.278211  ORF Transcript_104562/g.278211 Transcript_104562/m.278211 type:complete len:228 (+) Transcript_104562:676-1359(+)
MTPNACAPDVSARVTITQFWCLLDMPQRASAIVAPGVHKGNSARGFMIPNTGMLRTFSRASESTPMPHNALAKSRDERMPTKPPSSVQTTRWWHARSLFTCTRMRTAASSSVVEGRTFISGSPDAGNLARPPRSQRLTVLSAGTPLAYASTMSFSVTTPTKFASSSSTPAAVRSCNVRRSTTSERVARAKQTTVPRCRTMSPTTGGVCACDMSRRCGTALPCSAVCQ